AGPGELVGSNGRTTYDAGVVSGLTVGDLSPALPGGLLEVLAGGSALNVAVNVGALTVDSGGAATATVVSGHAGLQAAQLIVSGVESSAVAAADAGGTALIDVASGGVTRSDTL